MGILTEPILIGVAVVALAGLAGSGVQTWRLHSEETAHATDNAKVAKERQDASDLARTWQAGTFHAYEVAQRTADDQRAAIQTQERKIADQQSRIVDLNMDIGRLRTGLANYARGGATDSLSACQDRASNLADKLGSCAGLVAEVRSMGKEIAGISRRSAATEAANAVAVNQCVNSWPKSPTSD